MRQRLHAPALECHRTRPAPPLILTPATERDHHRAVRAHERAHLAAAIAPAKPNRYTREMWGGILRLLNGKPSFRAKPLLKRENVMPHLREWAAKRGLIESQPQTVNHPPKAKS
jgi:hypothetical protein